MKNNRDAFSLIELSIVLIIIGLLVAGVTGGASLIESARTRALMSEISDWERAIFSFKAARDRLPGDVKDYGSFGIFSNYYDSSDSSKPYYEYKASDFPDSFIEEYRKTAGAGAIPDYNLAPFIELYTEGIIDSKPIIEGDSFSPIMSKLYGKNMSVGFIHTANSKDFSSEGDEPVFAGLANAGALKEVIQYSYISDSYDDGVKARMVQQIDEKLDDGKSFTGRMRVMCVDSADYKMKEYKDIAQKGGKCLQIYYAI